MALKAVKTKVSLADKAYRELKRKILDNELHSSQQMTEAEVSVLLNMSRTPTREAMLQLASEGLIELKPRHGMRVKPISIDDMQEIYEILTGLESTAAALCATKGLTKEQLSLMHDAVDTMNKTLDQDNLTEWAQADEQFHRYLVEFADNNRLQSLVSNFIEQSHRFRMLTLKMRPKPTNSNKDHLDVISAIENRNSEKARLIHHQHREKSGRMLIALIKGVGLNHI
ncbi:GntR family transcriptional regulator [Marinomonas sp. 2405UD68-3]|uniref:GntR family transcriptional regulator n=1 Tax=Marinomonas sp. 2405UD68-3 TaxID=3391835 RepID=UPI0039C9ACC1